MQHRDVQTYLFKNVPLDRDVFLIDERWLLEYKAARIEMFNAGEYRPNLDEQSHHSLRFKYEFDKDQLPRVQYDAPFGSAESRHVYTDCSDDFTELESRADKA